MEITTQERVKDLKLYKFNEELFDLLKGSDYNALKRDIKQNGVKVELHILPDKTVICGHQRLCIAKELGMSHLRCKTVTDLDTPEKVREYVILDNLLRRHLTPEKQAFLLDDLSKQYEIGRRGRTKEERIEDANSASSIENVLDKTAKMVNVSPRTVANARAYAKAVKSDPEKYAGKKISVVLKEVQRKKKSEDGKKIDVKSIGITFKLGDFTKVLDDIPDESIDLILTDPPYPIEFIDCWSKLADFAFRKLKKNGFCIAYSGHKNLYEVMKRMEILDFYWMFALKHSGNTKLLAFNNIVPNWKPILIYQKGFKKIDNKTDDFIEGTGRSKFNHDWEQSLGEIDILLTSFSNEGDMVVDPFAGSGTVLVASKKLKRVSIGAEENEDTYNIAKKRISESIE